MHEKLKISIAFINFFNLTREPGPTEGRAEYRIRRNKHGPE
jgi:hypothetical protein